LAVKSRIRLGTAVSNPIRSSTHQALRKARTQRLEDGSPVHSFRTLLGELKTLTRSRVLPPNAPAAAAFVRVAWKLAAFPQVHPNSLASYRLVSCAEAMRIKRLTSIKFAYATGGRLLQGLHSIRSQVGQS
jgi:hypothetical protein